MARDGHMYFEFDGGVMRLQDIDFDLNLGHASALDIQLPPILVNVLAQFIDEIAHAAIRPPLSMKCARQLVNR